MIEKREENPSPEERTAAFFNRNYDEVARALHNRVIALSGTDRKIVCTDLVAYSRAENLRDRKYKLMSQMQPGTLWALPFPLRRVRLLLVVASDDGETGACIRVKRAGLMSTGGIIVPMPKEGDIADYLGLEDNEILSLAFKDQSEILYLYRPDITSSDKVDPTKANRNIQDLLRE